MKKPITITLLVIVMGLLVVLSTQVIAAYSLRLWIESRMNGFDQSGKIRLDPIDLSLLHPGKMAFKNIKASHQSGKTSQIEVEVDRIDLDVSLKSLLYGHLHINSLVFRRPQIVLTDTDAPKAKKESTDSPDLPPIDLIQLSEGQFFYRSVTQGAMGEIKVSKISGSIDNLHSANLRALIEKSGKIELRGAGNFFRSPFRGELNMKLEHFDLSELTPFLKIDDGVLLEGKVNFARGLVQINDKQISANVSGNYQKLGIKLLKTGDRSPLEAFLMNLGAKMVLTKDGKNQAPSSIERHEDESIVHFILRGLKVACLRLAKK